MASETVRIYAVDESSAALEGVLVRFYDDGDSFVTQQYTSLDGGDAYAEVTLDGDDPPNAYTIRLSKTGVAFDGALGDDSKTPQAIGIWSPPANSPTGTNDFTVQGQTFERPVATDPLYCRCSGFFKDIAGRPLANLDIHFINEQTPLIVGGFGALGSTVWGRTDADGYFVLDLAREGCYRVRLESLEIQLRAVTVPDQSSVDLIALLFPVVDTVAFDPDPVSMAVGEAVDVTVTITDTAGNVHDLDDGDVTFTVADSDVASISFSGGLMVVTGAASGSTTITPSRDDDTIIVKPEPTFVALDVTVA